MVLDDRRLKVRDLADMVGISKSVVHLIFMENLDISKLCARWVARLLTMEQKRCRALKNSSAPVAPLTVRRLHCRFGATVAQISGVQMRESKGQMLSLMCDTARAPTQTQ